MELEEQERVLSEQDDASSGRREPSGREQPSGRGEPSGREQPSRREQPSGEGEQSDPDRARVAAACRVMDDAGGPVAAEDLASAAHCSPRQLHRAFAAVLQVTPLQYGRAVRTGRAREVLRSAGTVTDAVWEAGYGSARGFYEEAGRRLGMRPAEFAAGARGRRLQWSAVDTVLGAVLVVVSPDGICAVRIAPGTTAAEPEAMLAEVREELPHAELVRDDEALVHVTAAVQGLARGERPAGDRSTDLPLDVAGTAFQARVWQALREIPAGSTHTYTQVAAAIGSPSSVRAVARACATNPVALVVPCHRVIRSDGSLAGYRWGLEVKRSLLDAERRARPAAGHPAPTLSG
ncbi:methylated-DNA--[protein]-cysteine S-methyltransferase [Aquipuribacter sp. MA13-6]|uniref:methylated-DNA--[protein]-cysteine S-methyltransferase n=1 Tax=Aquipuribacter sp. MA13-6 TaxID=3440839 RepID=UPI003EE9AA09